MSKRGWALLAAAAMTAVTVTAPAQAMPGPVVFSCAAGPTAARSGSCSDVAQGAALGLFALKGPGASRVPVVCRDGQGPVNRYQSCVTGRTTAGIKTDKGRLLGTVTVETAVLGELARTSRSWAVKARTRLVRATGILARGTQMASTLACRGCQVDGPDTDWLALTPGQVWERNWQARSESPSGAITSSDQQLALRFRSPSRPETATVTSRALGRVRCDTESYMSRSAGCVYTQATPVFALSATAPPPSPASAAFVSDALRHQPGDPHGQPLRRLVGDKRIDANRAASCKGFVKAGPADSCDEYPFASTRQGGKSAAVAHVPLADNQAAGSKLAAFYLANRVLDNDPFFVHATR